MGFTPQEKIYSIDFAEGHDLHGLHLKMRSLSLGQYNHMMRLGMVPGVNEKAMDANDEMVALFADKIVDWDLEIPVGHPVPATVEGVLSVDRSYIGQMVTGWQLAMLGISEALGKGSQNGQQSQEESLGLGT
jgi:hypothetical protein